MTIDGVPVAGLTAPALLLLTVLLVLTGRLIPRRTHQDMIRERDEWREAWIKACEHVSIQAKQIDELLEVGQTVNAIMRALPHPREEGRR